MEGFDWGKITLAFPEYNFESPGSTKEGFDRNYPQEPKFTNGKVDFRFEKEYGIQLFLNHTIPSWIKSLEKPRFIEEVYQKLSEKVYNEILGELERNFWIFENWRKFVQKFDKVKGWGGNLQNNIEFTNESRIIYHPDYYQIYPDGENIHPTDILLKIGKIPKNFLNEDMKQYHDICENVHNGEGKGCCNQITGKTLTECISNADKIYNLASKLGELDF